LDDWQQQQLATERLFFVVGFSQPSALRLILRLQAGPLAILQLATRDMEQAHL
jgi:hypothetical protein